MVSTEDKVQYRDLLEPKELIAIKNNVERIGGHNSGEESSKTITAKIYEREGTVYNVEQLIDQSESDEKLKVKLNEELAANKEKISKLSKILSKILNNLSSFRLESKVN